MALLVFCPALLACIHCVVLLFYCGCLGFARPIEAVVVCGAEGTDNTRRVVSPLHRRTIMGWNYGFRPRPTVPVDSETLSLGRYAGRPIKMGNL